jgi:exodeoxyribonuclease-3
VRCGDVHVITAYVPNGRTPGSRYGELSWPGRLQAAVASADRPSTRSCLGDLNIAVTGDVYDPPSTVGTTPPVAEQVCFAAPRRLG